MNEFGRAFNGADAVVLADIYPASEDPIPGVNLETLAARVREQYHGELEAVAALDNVPAAIARKARRGDLILLLGAGSIGSIWPDVLSELERSGN
jgi:UDP-N-acetylmuramate--alanine ligase